VNEKFANHTTNTAFNLQLSRAMVKYLVLLSLGLSYIHRTNITTGDSCVRRGLVEEMISPYHRQYTQKWFIGPSKWYEHKLSLEGEMVLELLKSCGLYDSVCREYEIEIGRVA